MRCSLGSPFIHPMGWVQRSVIFRFASEKAIFDWVARTESARTYKEATTVVIFLHTLRTLLAGRCLSGFQRGIL